MPIAAQLRVLRKKQSKKCHLPILKTSPSPFCHLATISLDVAVARPIAQTTAREDLGLTTSYYHGYGIWKTSSPFFLIISIVKST